ncbi:MAG: hypothetical protein QF464_14595, partial [Myxococcota bacterium]|nr:hypothetical protein [Myxococcota bacterium]
LATQIDEVVEIFVSMPGIGGARIPSQQRSVAYTLRVFRTVGDFFEHLSDFAPVVTVIRGADKMDRLSRDLFQYLTFRLEDRPFFLLALAETTDVPLTFQRIIPLEELSRQAVRHELAVLLKGPVSASLLETVYAKARGNPFLVSELVRYLVTTGAVHWNGRHWSQPDAIDDAADIESLTMDDVLLSDLAGVPTSSRAAIECAAVCGRVFWNGQLEAMLETEGLADALIPLAEREVILPQPVSRFTGHLEFAFRHARVRECLYARIDEDRRQLLHQRAAEWLLKHSLPELSDVALITFHLDSSNQPDRASEWRDRLAQEATRWEHEDGPPWSDWPEDSSSGVFTTSG